MNEKRQHTLHIPSAFFCQTLAGHWLGWHDGVFCEVSDVLFVQSVCLGSTVTGSIH